MDNVLSHLFLLAGHDSCLSPPAGQEWEALIKAAETNQPCYQTTDCMSTDFMVQATAGLTAIWYNQTPQTSWCCSSFPLPREEVV